MPWNKYHPIPRIQNAHEFRIYLHKMRLALNNVYGLEPAKEELMLFFAQKILIPPHMDIPGCISIYPNRAQILALEGPPGVGKTYLLQSLAKALDLPFESIPLGGCKDSSFLDGHSYTYEASMPGRIVQALKNMKYSNGIIYFDELDKLSDSKQGSEVSSLLLHVLDETQNHEFYDKYFSDIPIDLSKIFFVLSINDRNKIDPVLRQRLFIVPIKKPEIKDKVIIARDYILPLILNQFHMNKEELQVSDQVLQYLIVQKTEKEDGVRSLKQILSAIVKRIFLLKHALWNENIELLHDDPFLKDLSFFQEKF